MAGEIPVKKSCILNGLSRDFKSSSLDSWNSGLSLMIKKPFSSINPETKPSAIASVNTIVIFKIGQLFNLFLIVSR